MEPLPPAGRRDEDHQRAQILRRFYLAAHLAHQVSAEPLPLADHPDGDHQKAQILHLLWLPDHLDRQECPMAPWEHLEAVAALGQVAPLGPLHWLGRLAA